MQLLLGLVAIGLCGTRAENSTDASADTEVSCARDPPQPHKGMRFDFLTNPNVNGSRVSGTSVTYSCQLPGKTMINIQEGTDQGGTMESTCNGTHWSLDLKDYRSDTSNTIKGDIRLFLGIVINH